MPYYGGKPNGAEGIITVVIWLGIAYSSFGWPGVAIAASVLIVGISIVFGLVALQQRREARELCTHGTVGAQFDSTKCPSCTEEKRQVQERAERAARESAERATAERAQAYADWISRIRLPEYLKSMHPQKFEHLVCELFRRLGHDVEPTRYVSDGGIDAYLRKDGKLTILQCKRVKGSVGEPILRDLFGTMTAKAAASAIVVTTGKVSDQARRWIQGKPIRIVEVDELRDLLTKHFSETDVVPSEFHPDKGLAGDTCPKCHRPLRQVRGRRGPFWGCSGYPTCRYTQSNRFELRGPPQR